MLKISWSCFIIRVVATTPHVKGEANHVHKHLPTININYLVKHVSGPRQAIPTMGNYAALHPLCLTLSPAQANYIENMMDS